jgi:16S rRNA (guanine(966)-N(2))-methyltransferase RsmD
MRIVAGRFKGRTLKGPTRGGVRPTSDGLRETLFNVIGSRIDGARVLDGFAGTGAVGLEALSRGAAGVTFVEQDRHAADVIRQNVAACAAGAGTELIVDDARRVFARLAAARAFDIVFLDPPYDAVDLDAHAALAAAIVGPGGLLIVEHSRQRASPDRAGDLPRSRVLVAGDSALSFYMRPPAG